MFETRSSLGVIAPPFLGGRISTFTLKALPTQVSVFCPKAAISAGQVDVLVYAHGLLGVCGTVDNPPEGLITGSIFRLGELVDSSGRAMVLIVPLFDWTRPGFHFLGKPPNLNTLIAESLQQLATMLGSAAPGLANLILAGHSRGYDFLEPLARANADPQMGQGALARLSEVWAFDTTYVCDVASWLKWVASKPNLKVSAFYRRDTKAVRTPVGTMEAGDALFAAQAQADGRLKVVQISVETLPGPREAAAGFTRWTSFINRRLSRSASDRRWRSICQF